MFWIFNPWSARCIIIFNEKLIYMFLTLFNWRRHVQAVVWSFYNWWQILSLIIISIRFFIIKWFLQTKQRFWSALLGYLVLVSKLLQFRILKISNFLFLVYIEWIWRNWKLACTSFIYLFFCFPHYTSWIQFDILNFFVINTLNTFKFRIFAIQYL